MGMDTFSQSRCALPSKVEERIYSSEIAFRDFPVEGPRCSGPLPQTLHPGIPALSTLAAPFHPPIILRESAANTWSLGKGLVKERLASQRLPSY